jgi:hypothetical protein
MLLFVEVLYARLQFACGLSFHLVPAGLHLEVAVPDFLQFLFAGESLCAVHPALGLQFQFYFLAVYQFLFALFLLHLLDHFVVLEFLDCALGFAVEFLLLDEEGGEAAFHEVELVVGLLEFVQGEEVAAWEGGGEVGGGGGGVAAHLFYFLYNSITARHCSVVNRSCFRSRRAPVGHRAGPARRSILQISLRNVGGYGEGGSGVDFGRGVRG